MFKLNLVASCARPTQIKAEMKQSCSLSSTIISGPILCIVSQALNVIIYTWCHISRCIYSSK